MNRFSLRWVLAVGLASMGLPAWGTAAALPGSSALRAAIEDLSATFPDRYKGKEFLARLDRVQTDAELTALRREALVANPLVSGQPLLVIVRPQYAPDHHNTETMFQTGEINTQKFRGPGAIKLIDVARLDFEKHVAPAVAPVVTARARKQKPVPAAAVVSAAVPGATVLVELPDGVARDPDVSFDGKKILFSMRRNTADDYHLYEINADGSGLRQLTSGPGVTDFDPIYLPDGRILFASTREPKYCMCNRHIMGNLFTMSTDGTGLQQIGHNPLHEGHPALLADGRVIYDRWEYVDRNFGNAQGLWTCNPDGTNHVIYYGNNTASPGAKLEARPIPGTELVICTFSSCHDRPWGALAILDRRLGTEGLKPVVRTWPDSAIDLVGRGGFDTYKQVKPKYEDPYPLSDKYFLCSRMTGNGEQMGIYLLDTFGNEVLVYAEELGCYDPMPLAERPKPPAIPARIDLASNEGYFYVSNVYEGTGMDEIPRGTVRWLRVVESPEKRFWTPPAWDGGTGQQAPGMAWNDFNNKQILGTVPVEPDGSASFAVPADRFVYFQVLDERGRMIQSMRSGTIVRPGERTGCVGCHESRQSSVPLSSQSIAMRRSPSQLQPWYGPPRNFGYLAEVQPVFDKHCVSCHDYGKEAGKKLNLAGDLNLCFNTSYVELRAKNYVRVVGAGPPDVQPPKSWGSHASPLARVLLEGHANPEIDRQVKLDPEGRDRIITWIDINAPYYPEYAGGAYRNNLYGRSPINGQQLAELDKLTGAQLRNKANMTLVNFTRPELSECLARLTGKNEPRYEAALRILRAGKDNLAANPRPDMPNFRLTDKIEIDQQCKYDALRKAEAQARAARLGGAGSPQVP